MDATRPRKDGRGRVAAAAGVFDDRLGRLVLCNGWSVGLKIENVGGWGVRVRLTRAVPHRSDKWLWRKGYPGKFLDEMVEKAEAVDEAITIVAEVADAATFRRKLDYVWITMERLSSKTEDAAKKIARGAVP